jgi:hypothetical protein
LSPYQIAVGLNRLGISTAQGVVGSAGEARAGTGELFGKLDLCVR